MIKSEQEPIREKKFLLSEMRKMEVNGQAGSERWWILSDRFDYVENILIHYFNAA